MKLIELLDSEIISDEESICIQDSEFNVLELNEKAYISEQYMECEIEMMWAERFESIASVGICIMIAK